MSIAPGPDGLTPRQLRAVPLNVLIRVLNLMMLCERLPKHLLDVRTIFIPNKPDAVDPADFRPITISSALANYFTVFWLRGSIEPWNSVKGRGPSGQASMVAETTPFSLIPSFAVDMS